MACKLLEEVIMELLILVFAMNQKETNKQKQVLTLNGLGY